MQYFVQSLARVMSACLLCASFNLHAETQADAWELLSKAALAGHVLSYTGIFVYDGQAQTKAVQVKHIYDGRGEYSRNVTLDTRPRELFSEGQDLVIYNPNKEKVVIKKRQAKNLFPNLLPLKVNRLKAGYTLHAAETDRVAGRPARLLLLMPKDQYRYGYQLWVDAEYGILLKYEMHDAKHAVLEQIAFNELKLVETLDLNWYKPQIDTSKLYEMEALAPAVPDSMGNKPWRVTKIPVGFKKINQVKVSARAKAKAYMMTQLVYSDGLAAVSLFIEPLAEDMVPLTGQHVKGYTSLYATVKEGYQVTAIGEVPTDTVVKFGNAIEFNTSMQTNEAN